MPVGTHLDLLVVGAISPIAVPCLARQGARRSEPAATTGEISICREGHVRRGFRNKIRTPTVRSLARLVRHFFLAVDTI
jgi:hypothetical protein